MESITRSIYGTMREPSGIEAAGVMEPLNTKHLNVHPDSLIHM